MNDQNDTSAPLSPEAQGAAGRSSPSHGSEYWRQVGKCYRATARLLRANGNNAGDLAQELRRLGEILCVGQPGEGGAAKEQNATRGRGEAHAPETPNDKAHWASE